MNDWFDDEVWSSIERRLAGIESFVPEPPPWRPASQPSSTARVRVELGTAFGPRGGRRSAARPLVWAVVVVGLIATLFLGSLLVGSARPSPQVSPPPLATGSPSPSPTPLSISNGTTISVTLVVNGTVVETVAPGGYEDPVKAALPSLPWSIETRSPSGRTLSRLIVHAGDVVYTTPDASGHSSAKGDAVRVDLSCGRLDVWSGPPLFGPMWSPGPSGDCA